MHSHRNLPANFLVLSVPETVNCSNPMGHCISMLRKMTRRRQPEPTRGTPKPPLFVVRGDHRPPQVLPFQAQSFGQLQFAQKPAAGRADNSRSGHEKFRHEVDPGVLDRRRCAPKLVRLLCRSTCSTSAVEPVAAEERPLAPTTKTPPQPPQEGNRTPMVAPPMTPMRPVWQRRILMGMRCELPVQRVHPVRRAWPLNPGHHAWQKPPPVEKEECQGCYNTQGPPPIDACQKVAIYQQRREEML